ncbi:MAG: Cache 3/Cache 2 fusion domain-containing protein [Pseudomonadota bacterium]|nr:Cache 3/Cache 2 fusion domain-containing protein [Pseudomonadota bacterium]
MLKNLKLREKFMIPGALMTLIPLLVLGYIANRQSNEGIRVATQESIKLAKTDLDHIAEGVYNMCVAQNDLLQKNLQNNMAVTQKLIKDNGGLRITSEDVTWNAVNQVNQAVSSVALPKMLIGNLWLGQANDPNTEVPIVDELQNLFGNSSCTIFQRMNTKGDMVRIATNVLQKDGLRQIGSYTPSTLSDGNLNPTIKTILSGLTATGRVDMGKQFYLTINKPIFDGRNQVIGMLEIGIPQDNVESFRKAIYDIKIGTTGYLWVLNSQGHYVISKNGLRDGADISQAKDSSGRLFVKALVDTGKAQKPGGIGEERYPWRNKGETADRMKIARVMYFAPWDWVIGAGSYEDEFLASATKLGSLSKQNQTFFWIIIGITSVIGSLIWLLVSRGIANPIRSIASSINTSAQNHDLTVVVPVVSSDELGLMGGEFNKMMKVLNEAFRMVNKSSQNVANYSNNVNQRASANQQRAENQAAQMQKVQQTVEDMRSTAQEVAGLAESQSAAATTSSSKIEHLVESMQTITDASDSQQKEVSTATERVQAMGDTGSQVVKTAQKQGERVVAVTQAVNSMDQIAQELGTTSTRAMELANNALKAANEGTESVASTVNGMHAIAQSSEQISEIITVITDITEQTNLLSLNAAIEAARAGVHGKGFAVVADEVGKLAQRSSDAAKEITKLIKDSSAQVAEGTRLSDRSRLALEEIVAGSNNSLQATREIGQATEKIVVGINDVNTMMEELNTLAREIGEMAGQQGERRATSQAALANLMEKSTAISALIQSANSGLSEIGQQMEEIVGRSASSKELTDLQAQRSLDLVEITTESTKSALETKEGAETVVSITNQLQKMSQVLTQQAAQFKLESDS